MNLRQKRHEAHMTQTQVSKALGLSIGAYGHYENGRRNPKPETLKKIAETFNCTVDALLADPEDANDPR